MMNVSMSSETLGASTLCAMYNVSVVTSLACPSWSLATFAPFPRHQGPHLLAERRHHWQLLGDAGLAETPTKSSIGGIQKSNCASSPGS